MNAPLLPALPGYDDPQLIAHGTTALVFRATQTALNRPVAIKVITADTNAGSVPVNVERELATTVALSSQPHIVSIIDTGVTADDRRYIVMEYCEGGSYAQILRQQGPLPVDDVVEVGIKIGQALHAAHEVGIVHRDVKPSNILRSRFGPALTDFGIARAPDELSSTLTREMMTPHHASPEALLHQAQSGLSDVYSLASTMWTLLVGHPPFVDPKRPDLDMYQFRDRVLHDPLPAMPREDVPDWLVAELHRAMAKLPSQRHGSALEFSEALQRAALGVQSAPAPAASAPTVVRPPATDGEPVRHSPGLPAQAWPTPDEPPRPGRPVLGQPPIAVPATPTAAPTTDAAESPSPATDEPLPAAVPPLARGRAPAPAFASPQAVPDAPPVPTPPAPAPPIPPVAAPPAPTPPPPAPPLPSAPDDAPIYRPRPVPAAASAPATHPLSGAEPAPPPAIEQDGWLPRTEEPAAPAWPAPSPARVQPRPHRDGVTAPSGGRRGGLLAVLVGVLVIAATSGVLLFSQIGTSRNTPTSEASGASPSVSVEPTLITAGTEGAPTDVRIEEDLGTSVTLAWSAPADGRGSYVAVAYLAGSTDPVEVLTVPGGQARTSVTFTNLDANENYCFAVGVLYSVNEFAPASVCTTR